MKEWRFLTLEPASQQWGTTLKRRLWQQGHMQSELRQLTRSRKNRKIRKHRKESGRGENFFHKSPFQFELACFLSSYQIMKQTWFVG